MKKHLSNLGWGCIFTFMLYLLGALQLNSVYSYIVAISLFIVITFSAFGIVRAILIDKDVK
jgi:hypothetical protein